MDAETHAGPGLSKFPETPLKFLFLASTDAKAKRQGQRSGHPRRNDKKEGGIWRRRIAGLCPESKRRSLVCVPAAVAVYAWSMLVSPFSSERIPRRGRFDPIRFVTKDIFFRVCRIRRAVCKVAVVPPRQPIGWWSQTSEPNFRSRKFWTNKWEASLVVC